MGKLPREPGYFVERLLGLGRAVRGAVVAGRDVGAAFSGVVREARADTIYELDAQVEPVIEAYCEEWGREMPLVLIAEGIAGEGGAEGKAVFPRGSRESDAAVQVICDPIDGTRGLMYDKRAAWFLAGVAPNRGEATRLSDIAAAVMVEIPTSKQGAADVLWAVREGGAKGRREGVNAEWGMGNAELPLRPSQAETIAHGFAMISNFFPGTKELASRLMERIVERCIGAADVGKAMVFDDQYISTGGQLYELLVGHDRFNADLRPVFYGLRGLPVGMCVHPYDVASVLIATEAGVEITDGLGRPLDGPLDVTTPLSWAGFANRKLRERVEPVMLEVLKEWRKISTERS
jgi:hypothetical protein